MTKTPEMFSSILIGGSVLFYHVGKPLVPVDLLAILLACQKDTADAI